MIKNLRGRANDHTYNGKTISSFTPEEVEAARNDDAFPKDLLDLYFGVKEEPIDALVSNLPGATQAAIKLAYKTQEELEVAIKSREVLTVKGVGNKALSILLGSLEEKK